MRSGRVLHRRRRGHDHGAAGGGAHEQPPGARWPTCGNGRINNDWWWHKTALQKLGVIRPRFIRRPDAKDDGAETHRYPWQQGTDEAAVAELSLALDRHVVVSTLPARQEAAIGIAPKFDLLCVPVTDENIKILAGPDNKSG